VQKFYLIYFYNCNNFIKVSFVVKVIAFCFYLIFSLFISVGYIWGLFLVIDFILFIGENCFLLHRINCQFIQAMF